MMSLLVMELAAAVGYLGLLANNGIVSLASISIRPWLVNLCYSGQCVEHIKDERLRCRGH